MRPKLQQRLKIMSVGLVCALSAGLCIPPNAEAEIRTIEADGLYIMGDGTKENPAVAKERAREDAKRAAGEKASVYVESLSEVKNGHITEDVIRTVSANVLEVQKSDITVEVAEGNALFFRCHIVAKVDSGRVAAELGQDGQELAESARRNKELETQVAQVNAELDSLKDAYAKAMNEREKEKIRAQVKANEQKFAAAQLLEQGNIFMREQNFPAASEAFKEALSANPDEPIAYYRLGDACRMMKAYGSAVANYQKAIDLNPDYADAYNNLGFTYEQMGAYGEAFNNYQKAIECDAGYANAYYNLGNNCFRLQHYQEAIENYRQAINIDSRYIMAYNNLGLAYSGLKAYDKAIESFTKAINEAAGRSNVDLAKLYNNRGTCYQQTERFTEASADYAKAAELDPDYTEPRTNQEQLETWLRVNSVA